ncbi:PIN domain nuclease [Actinoplanes sp. NPDC049802]|uniref:PIN domain nuclease n=1 Tax=Actinoplanes sp. NPDC049802 TaxID=3154742 RepID=UPI0034100F79
MTVEYLVDTSAYMRLAREAGLREAWRPWFVAGTLSLCPLTKLEIYFTARSAAHRKDLESTIRNRYGWVLMPDVIFSRAAQVQDLLTRCGAQRSAGPVDLLVAATAEVHGMTILHYGRDFMSVAEVTGQPVRWIAEPGSVD